MGVGAPWVLLAVLGCRAPVASPPPTWQPHGDFSTWTGVGTTAAAGLGAALTACDADGDGTNDLFVGAPGPSDAWTDGATGALYRVEIKDRDGELRLLDTPGLPQLGLGLDAVRGPGCTLAATWGGAGLGGVLMGDPADEEWAEHPGADGVFVLPQVWLQRRRGVQALVGLAGRDEGGTLRLGLARMGGGEVLLAPRDSGLSGVQLALAPDGDRVWLGIPDAGVQRAGGLASWTADRGLTMHFVGSNGQVAAAALATAQVGERRLLVVGSPGGTGPVTNGGRVDVFDVSGEPERVATVVGAVEGDWIGQAVAAWGGESLWVAVGSAREAVQVYQLEGDSLTLRADVGTRAPAAALLFADLDGTEHIDLAIGTPTFGRDGSGHGAVQVVFDPGAPPQEHSGSK